MVSTLQSKEPMAIAKSMDSYFQTATSDFVLISKEFCKLPIHKELFYQTEFMRSMIKSAGFEDCCSTLEIFCPFVTIDQLEGIVQFLYKGTISIEHQAIASEISSLLTILFGFPFIETEDGPKIETVENIKIEPEETTEIEVWENREFEDQEVPKIKVEEEPVIETDEKIAIH